MSDASLCRLHPDRPALGPCDRCGGFGCSECLQLTGVQRLCPDCRARSVTGLPSLAGRAQWVKPGLYGTAAVSLALSLASLGVDAKTEQLSPLLALVGLLGLGYLGVFIATIVVYCRWFHLAVRYTEAKGTSLGVTPAGAVGSWFIPFVNLVRPFALTRSMLMAHGGDAGKVTAWQGLWFAANVSANISSRIDNDALGVVAAALLVAAAVLAAQVVTDLTRVASGYAAEVAR